MRGRIRNVKPEVHLDEELWDLESRSGLPIFRALVGLWNYADREGRFEWRPRALQAVILPWWPGDFGAALDALAEKFLIRYEVDGRTFGAIRNFTKHQAANHKEAASKLPPPPDVPGKARESPGTSRTRDDVPSETLARVPVVPVGIGSGSGSGSGSDLDGKARERANTDNPLPAIPEHKTEPSTYDLVRVRFCVRYAAARAGDTPGTTHRTPGYYRTIAEWIDKKGGDAPVLIERLLDGFFADAWAAREGFPLGALAGNPSKYFAPSSAPLDARKGVLRPESPEAFKGHKRSWLDEDDEGEPV